MPFIWGHILRAIIIIRMKHTHHLPTMRTHKLGNRLGLLPSLASLKEHMQAPTAFQPSLLSPSSCDRQGVEPGISFLHWVTSNRAESIRPRTGDADQAPPSLTSSLLKWTLKPFLPQLICKLLSNSTYFVFYEWGWGGWGQKKDTFDNIQEGGREWKIGGDGNKEWW